MIRNLSVIPQLGAATALVQLLSEFPALPAASWSIDQSTGTLHGHVHYASFDDLSEYAAVLGGSIRPGTEYEYEGVTMRPHRLYATWRDVQVCVAVALPAPVKSAVAA